MKIDRKNIDLGRSFDSVSENDEEMDDAKRPDYIFEEKAIKSRTGKAYQSVKGGLCKKLDSIFPDGDTAIVAQSEEDIVSFGTQDTIFIIKGGLIEGQVTLKEIAEAINDCTQKNNG